MQNQIPEKASPHLLQIHALRDALERAARAASNSEMVARQLKTELINEQRKLGHASSEVQRLTKELDEAIEENKRLRRSVGEFFQERETLTARIRQLSATPGTAGKPVLQVVPPVADPAQNGAPPSAPIGLPAQKIAPMPPTPSSRPAPASNNPDNAPPGAVAPKPIAAPAQPARPPANLPAIGDLKLAPPDSGPISPPDAPLPPPPKSNLKLAEDPQ